MPDLLVSGSERELHRLPPRARTLGAVALAVAAAAAGAGALVQHLQERAEQRSDTASAAADEVAQRGRLLAVTSAGIGTGRLLADVGVTGERRGRLTGVRLTGPGLTSVPGPAPVLHELPASVSTEATVDCAGVPGRLPDRAWVVLTGVPSSGGAREQRLSASPAMVREAVLQACDEPDPEAEPLVEVSAQDGRLVLYVETVPRSDADLRIERVQVPGFALAGVALPYRLMPDSGGLYGFSLRVADCTRAREADTTVTVRLSADGVLVERVAAVARPQPQAGAVPVAELLAELVAARC